MGATGGTATTAGAVSEPPTDIPANKLSASSVPVLTKSPLLSFPQPSGETGGWVVTITSVGMLTGAGGAGILGMGATATPVGAEAVIIIGDGTSKSSISNRFATTGAGGGGEGASWMGSGTVSWASSAMLSLNFVPSSSLIVVAISEALSALYWPILGAVDSMGATVVAANPLRPAETRRPAAAVLAGGGPEAALGSIARRVL